MREKTLESRDGAAANRITSRRISEMNERENPRWQR
jgi:hypothetical protein